jgi:hypothetical protein
MTKLVDTFSGKDDREEMEKLIGMEILTEHGKSVRRYVVTGLTSLPLRYLRVHRESMTGYYLVKHGITLKYLHLPCFETKSSHIIPVELVFLEDFTG